MSMHPTTDPKLQLLILFHEYERDGATAFLKVKNQQTPGWSDPPFSLRVPATAAGGAFVLHGDQHATWNPQDSECRAAICLT